VLAVARMHEVDAEQLVIDRPLDEVEEAPPADERADEQPPQA
jgi:hypothetical protein